MKTSGSRGLQPARGNVSHRRSADESARLLQARFRKEAPTFEAERLRRRLSGSPDQDAVVEERPSPKPKKTKKERQAELDAAAEFGRAVRLEDWENLRNGRPKIPGEHPEIPGLNAKIAGPTRSLSQGGVWVGDPKEVDRLRRRLARLPGSSEWTPTKRFRREPGEDHEEDRDHPLPTKRDWAEDASEASPTGRCKPAFPGNMTHAEAKRLKKAQGRVAACKAGTGMEIEHTPCGKRTWIRFGCRVRICGHCGENYRAKKRQRFEVLGRVDAEQIDAAERSAPINQAFRLKRGVLRRTRIADNALAEKPPSPLEHTDTSPAPAGDAIAKLPSWKDPKNSSMKFLTLTFPDNLSWDTPAEAAEWFKARTRNLRHLLGVWKPKKHHPCSPERWNVRGYLAVWEVTAERTCETCQLTRAHHDRDTGKGIQPKPGERGHDGVWRTKKGVPIRANECPKWIPGRTTGRFHPHLHILVWSNFIPIGQLRKRWSLLGGGGQIRLEPMHGDAAVDYCLKYLSKPWKAVPDDLQIVGLFRIRRVTSTGAFYGQAFTDLSASLMENVEKMRTGIYCTHCHPEPPPLGSTLDDGFASDLREMGRPYQPPQQWRSVRTRLLLDADADEMEPATFAEFAWNGVFLRTVDDARRAKLLQVGKEAWDAAARVEPEDPIPF